MPLGPYFISCFVPSICSSNSGSQDNSGNAGSDTSGSSNNAVNSSTTPTLDQIRQFCGDVNAGKYYIALPIAHLLGLRSSCIGNKRWMYGSWIKSMGVFKS